jgi:hypothetical protein
MGERSASPRVSIQTSSYPYIYGAREEKIGALEEGIPHEKMKGIGSDSATQRSK